MAVQKQKLKIKNIIAVISAVFLAVFLFLPLSSQSVQAASISKKFNYQGRLGDATGNDKADGVYDMVFNFYSAAGGGNTLWTESWIADDLWTETGATTIVAGTGSNGCSTDNNKITYTTTAHDGSLKAGQTLWNTTLKKSAVIDSVNAGSTYICVFTPDPATPWVDGNDLTNRVYLKNGIFSITLGTVSALTLDFSSGDYYLGVKVESDAEMIPRKPLTSVPQAINANNLGGDGIIDLDNVNITQDAANINYDPASGANDALEITYGSGGTGIALKVTQSGTGDILNLFDGSTEVMTVLNGGNVGIGTSAPARSLEIYGGDSAAGYARITGGETYDSILELYADQGDDNPDKWSINSIASDNSLRFNNNTANILTLLSGGNVGIGTTNPSTELDLNGTMNISEKLGTDMVVDGGFAVATQYTAATAGVNTTNETITLSSNPGWAVGDTVAYYNGGGTTLAGLVDATSYFIASNAAGVIQVKTTIGGSAVNLTGTGNNAQYFIKTNWFAGTSGTTGGVAGFTLNAGVATKTAGVISLVPSVALVPTVGATYKIQYTISNFSTTSMTVGFGGVTTAAMITANGTYTHYVTAATTGSLIFTFVTGAAFTIDDVSIVPVSGGLTSPTGTTLFANKTLSNAVSNEVAYQLNYTVNKATAGMDTGLVINQTDVLSPGTSRLLDLQVGGATKFNVTNAGATTMAGLTATTIANSGTITSTVPTLYVSTSGLIQLGAASTGVTLALIPVQLSPRILQVGQAWGTANVLENWWQEVIPYPGTVNSKLSWYHAQGAMGGAAEYQAPEIMNYYNNGLNVLGSTYGSNILDDPTFSEGDVHWTVEGYGWTLAGTTATYTRSASGSGTLKQTSANFTTPVKANRWYRFTYSTLNQNTTVNAYIDPTGISQEKVYLRNVSIATAGTFTTTFKTNSSPGDFIITGYGTAASDKCDFQNVSLVEVQSGDIIANGLFTGGGTAGIKIDNLGNVGIGTTAPAQTLTLNGTLGINDADDSNVTIFQGGAQTGDITYTLPTGAPGGAGYVLSGTTAGVLSWAAQNAASLWTDGGTITYLTATGDDVAMGGSTSSSPFYLDVDANSLRLGSGATASAVLNMYASNAATGSITYTAADAWDFEGGNVGIGVTAPAQTLTLNGTFGILDADDSNATIFQGGAQTADITYTLPTGAPGGAGYVLSGTTAGVLSWAADVGFANPMSAIGDMIYGGTSGVPTRLAANANSGLALVSGGAGAPTWFAPTQGSLIFAGANGALTQDNANFFWNDSDNRLGIGTSAPATQMEIYSATASPIFTLTAADNSAFDPQIQFRTDGTPTVKFSMGVDAGDGDKFKIYSGSGIGDTSEFTIDSNGVTSIANLEMGAQSFEIDAGAVTWIDLPVVSAADNTVESYTAMLDGNAMLTIYGLATGSGGVDNLGVGIGTTAPAQTLTLNGTLGILDSDDSNATIFQGGAQTADITYTLPTGAPGGAGYVLSGTTAGVLSWAALPTGTLFTDGGAITYLTSNTDDFAVGATNSLTAPFSVDVSNSIARIGLGSGSYNGVLNIYSSNNHYLQLTHDGTNAAITADTGNINLGTSGDLTLGANVNIVGEGNFEIKGDATARTITLGDTGKANDDVVVIDASNLSISSGGTITDLQTYSDTVGVTNRDLFVDSTGKIGYVSSSIRYKQNVVDMEDISWLYQLRPVNYTYKTDGTDKEQYGLIAEEVDQINPLFVSYDAKGNPETVSYSMFAPVFIKALQEQKNSIDELAANNFQNESQLDLEIDEKTAFLEELNASLENQIANINLKLDENDVRIANLEAQVTDQQVINSAVDSGYLEFIESDSAKIHSALGANESQMEGLNGEVQQIKENILALNNDSGASDISDGGLPTDIFFQDNKDGFIIEDSITFKKQTFFAGMVEFINKVVFRSETEFAGNSKFNSNVAIAGIATFNSDTAGYAIVKTGSQFVEVKFENEYVVPPIINASLSLQQIEDIEMRKASEELLLVSDVKYIITNVTAKGFEIKIGRIAQSDIPFSWQATAVEKPKTAISEINLGEELSSQDLTNQENTVGEILSGQNSTIDESASTNVYPEFQADQPMASTPLGVLDAPIDSTP